MIFQTSDVSICNGSIKDPIGTSNFTPNITFKLFHVSLVNIRNLKYYLWFLNKYIYHKLVKFEQNQMILTTQNFELTDKKSFTKLTIFDISLAPFWKRFL